MQLSWRSWRRRGSGDLFRITLTVTPGEILFTTRVQEVTTYSVPVGIRDFKSSEWVYPILRAKRAFYRSPNDRNGGARRQSQPRVWDLSELTVKMGKMLGNGNNGEGGGLVEISKWEARWKMVAKMEIKLEEMAISEAEEVERKNSVISKQK